MNVLGMGPMEIVLIVVLALIVFGPAKLPQIMGQVGKAIADFRRATSELSDEFNRTIQAELQETRAVVDETKSAVTGVHTSINAAIAGTTAPALTTPAPAPPVANGLNGANGTNGTAVAEAPPLAETAKWSWETAAPAPDAPAVETTTSVATAVTAPEAAPAEPSTTAETPAEKPVEPPAPRPARTRKAPGRDEILPPY